MKKTFLPLVFIATCLLAACQGNDAESIRLAEARHAAQVEALMQQLSIREKVAQLFVMEISREPSVGDSRTEWIALAVVIKRAARMAEEGKI